MKIGNAVVTWHDGLGILKAFADGFTLLMLFTAFLILFPKIIENITSPSYFPNALFASVVYVLIRGFVRIVRRTK